MTGLGRNSLGRITTSYTSQLVLVWKRSRTPTRKQRRGSTLPVVLLWRIVTEADHPFGRCIEIWHELRLRAAFGAREGVIPRPKRNWTNSSRVTVTTTALYRGTSV